jgi:hypothetical protein
VDNLVYIKAVGAHDTIHQVWDFTKSTPTLILAVASVNSTMNITWDSTYPVKFSTSEKPKYSFATAVNKVKINIAVSHYIYIYYYILMWYPGEDKTKEPLPFFHGCGIKCGISALTPEMDCNQIVVGFHWSCLQYFS